MRLTKKLLAITLTGLITILHGSFLFLPTAVLAESSYASGMECYNANGWSASKVIYNVSRWYGLNPQVILATLQKEQSLVTTSTQNQYGLDWAMGYGVPDSGSRDYSKQGFAIQVDWGAWQLKWNMDKANSSDPAERSKVTPYYTGNTYSIDGVNTLFSNGSTASLYRYTPHFHGNQNFRNIVDSWFGPIAAWDSSRIVEDSFFGNVGTMSEADIQAFLINKGSYLANYTVPGTTVIGADSYRCPLPSTITVYRFWNNNGTHFYTASEAEKNNIISKWPNIYKFEGVSYVLNMVPQNNTPLYRFYNKTNNTHFYTASEAEKNNIIAKWPNIYQLEGIAYNVSATAGGTPVYRFWNTNGTHFYTASEAEKNNVIAKWPGTFKYEGIGYYIY